MTWFLQILIIETFFQDLRESLDKNQDKISKLKKMLKVYAKRLKDGEGKNHYRYIILP